MKSCKICAVVKPEGAFYIYNKNKNYRRSWCISCQQSRNKLYYVKNAEKLTAKKRKAYATDEYRQHRNLYLKDYRKTEIYRAAQQRSRNRPNNKQKRKDYMRLYAAKRRQADPKHRLDCSMSVAVWTALKKNKKGISWNKLLGYGATTLIFHLEKQFLPGMTWNNYGRNGWEVDHIKPRCAFEYVSSDDPEFLECWALSNLRPLWRQDNLAKAAADAKLSTKRKKLANQDKCI
jgi:hypothetical protein